jgi:uridine phosphorylase
MRHVRVPEGIELPRFALLPGDPGRAERIAKEMDTADLLSQNREFILYYGSYGGVDLCVCSTGIGGPSAAIALEELARMGVAIFIRVGSAGGRQPEIPIGSSVVLTAAYRGEGTSAAYLPPRFPAVADFDATEALIRVARQSDQPFWYGVGYTRDAYYVRDQTLDEVLKKAGAVAAEQEAATLFVVGAVLAVKVGAIVATDSNIWLPEQPPNEEKERLFREGERRTIRIALDAVVRLNSQR